MNSHPDNNTLLLFLYEELRATELQTVKGHASLCKICQRELALLQETLTLYVRLPLEVPAHEAVSSMLAQTKVTAPTESRSQAVFGFLCPTRSMRWAIASLGGFLLVSALVLLFKQPPGQPETIEIPGSARSLSQWRSPTDFLLESPGEQLLKTVPQLGDSLVEVKALLPNTIS